MNRIALISLFTCLLCGCFKDPYIPEPTNTLTLFEQLQSDDKYSEVAKALSKSGLESRLSAGEGPFTFFAPDNTTLNSYLGEQTIEDIPVEDLRNVLSYHIVDGLITADSLSDIGYLTSQSSNDNCLKGISILYEKNGNDLVLNKQIGVEFSAQGLANGILYPCDAILTIPTLEDFLNFQPSVFSIIQEGYDLINYSDELAVSGQHALFTPQNDAFTELFDTSGVNSLADYVALDANYADFLINYHLVQDSSFLTTDITDTTIIEMRSETNILLFRDTSNVENHQIIDSRSNTILLDEKDIQASNGIIQIIDRLMAP